MADREPELPLLTFQPYFLHTPLCRHTYAQPGPSFLFSETPMLFCFFFVPNLSLRFENRVPGGRTKEVLGAEIKFSVFEFLSDEAT